MLSKEEFVVREVENMKRDLGKLVSYPSYYKEDVGPFGSSNRQILDCALKMMSDIGLKTQNLDYYCGFGETGSGSKLIGILAHLDVVPDGEGWLSDPYKMIEKNGTLYGRGVSDDKGGVIASLYALKYLIEIGYPFKKRIRLITGCNEESGSKCVAYYVKKEGHMDCGFTPDAEFPGIFAEKGMRHGKIKAKGSKIINIKGGEASNIVCKICETTLPLNSFVDKKLKAYFNSQTEKVSYTLTKNKDNYLLRVTGVEFHASLPDSGVNAINHTFEALYAAEFDDELVNYYHRNIGNCKHGEKLGLDTLKDEYSDATMNVGKAYKKEDTIYLSVDTRFPVTASLAKVRPFYEPLNSGNIIFTDIEEEEPLFFDKKAPMVLAMLKAYQEVTGDKSEMLAIGGGTYAKAINNCIAFGCNFAGEDGCIHQANEYLHIKSLQKQVLIYIEAIKNLNDLEL